MGKIDLFCVDGNLSESIFKPVSLWLFQLNSQRFQTTSFESLVELKDQKGELTRSIPIMCQF